MITHSPPFHQSACRSFRDRTLQSGEVSLEVAETQSRCPARGPRKSYHAENKPRIAELLPFQEGKIGRNLPLSIFNISLTHDALYRLQQALVL